MKPAFPKRGVGELVVLAIVTGPALLLWHLHPLWNPDGAYAYGWVVPLLALFLCKSRWDDRPLPSAPLAGAVFFAVIFALVSLPTRWLQEAAPERGICTWSYAIACVGISLAMISITGGVSWLRWFGFPVIFILTAVPWPHNMEMFVSNFLMRGTAGTTVEILCLVGVPAAQVGNLVHIETGVIDIDEACSGIRSLQAMVMISFFLGELFRLNPPRRLLLVMIGLAVTLLANVIRTVVLSSIGFSRGMGAVDHYHDTAGFAVLILSLGATLFTAYRFRPAKETVPVSAPGGELTFPFKLSFAVLLWFLAAEISVEAWYRLHEPKWQGWSWSVQWPRQREAFHIIGIPANSLRILKCDESRAATWKEQDGSEWSLYSIRWNPGNPAAETAKVHRPDVCLNAEGATMEKDMGVELIPVAGLRMPFHSYTFRLGEKTLHVFFCLYEEQPGGVATGSDLRFEGGDMLQRALKGERHIGRQSMELALAGYHSESSAREAFKAHLGELLQTGQGGIPGPAK